MFPELFTLGGVTLYSYGLALAAGFAAGIVVSARLAPRSGIPSDRIYDAALPVLLSALAGAKLMYLGVHYRDVLADPGSVMGLIRGGFVFYGGLIGGLAGALVWLRRAGIPFPAFGDAVAPGLALAQGMGRVGCWLNGCCYGAPASWAWPVPALGDGVPRHPVQLYEAGGAFAICAILLVAGPGRARGRLLGAYLVLYSVLRFVVEFFRDDPRGGRLAGLTVSQLLSVAGLAAGLAVIRWAVRHRPGEAGK